VPTVFFFAASAKVIASPVFLAAISIAVNAPMPPSVQRMNQTMRRNESYISQPAFQHAINDMFFRTIR